MSDRIRNPASFASAPRPERPHKRRFGVLDLLVGAAVVLAVWSQTPVGALVDHTWVALTGGSPDALRPLTAHFDTGTGEGEALDALLARAAADPLPSTPDHSAAFPEPYRTAAHLVLTRGAPARARGLLREAVIEEPGTTWLDLLDARHEALGRPHPAETLELLVLDEDQRDRAISRAAAAGAGTPESWDAHRAYVPLRDRLVGDKLVRRTLALATALDLTWPVAGPHRITSPWGHRDHPVVHTRKFHNGVDLGVPIGTPILAAQHGTVRTGEDGVSGRYVVIDHGHGVRTSYCHLSELAVADGTAVKAGSVIARSGNTGRSTGPHLHFVVRVGRKTVDPERLRRRGAELDARGATPGT